MSTATELVPVEQPAADLPPVLLSMQRWLAGQSPSTATTYARALSDVAHVLTGSRELDAVQWQQIDHAALGMIRERLAQRYSNATANRDLAAVRSLLRQLARDGIITRERMLDAVEVRSLPPAEGARAGTLITRAELRAMLDTCAKLPAPHFHAALLTVLTAGGLRIAEAAAFFSSDLADYDVDKGRLLVRHGKGRKQRTVYFSGEARRIVSRFVRDDDRGERYRANLDVRLALRVRAIVLRTGIKRRITPHDFRRTFASLHFQRGTDVATIQSLMGHANVNQTASYDRRGEDRKVAAAFDPWD